MSDGGQEIEAKFYLCQRDEMIARLQHLQARLIQPRVLEINLRFDLPDDSLRSRGHVLRLRRDTESRLTYKGASKNDGGVLEREEIEFTVGNFEKARKFLVVLGYRESMYYEKYRATYELDDTLIMLDTLPYGDFIEIEGASVGQIQAVAAKLHLDWNSAIGTSYTALFERVRKALSLSFENLSFENFASINVTSDHLGVDAADR